MEFVKWFCCWNVWKYVIFVTQIFKIHEQKKKFNKMIKICSRCAFHFRLLLTFNRTNKKEKMREFYKENQCTKNLMKTIFYTSFEMHARNQCIPLSPNINVCRAVYSTILTSANKLYNHTLAWFNLGIALLFLLFSFNVGFVRKIKTGS